MISRMLTFVSVFTRVFFLVGLLSVVFQVFFQKKDAVNDSNLVQDQSVIINFFDSIYSGGTKYLRPTESYEYYLQMLDINNINPNHNITLLDVGCGSGMLLKQAIKNNLTTFGVDISPVAISICQKEIPLAKTFVSTATSLPFVSQSFNYLTCVGVLERVLEQQKALHEMQRVLLPDGKILILVRNRNSFEWKWLELFGNKETDGHQDAKMMNEWIDLFHLSNLEIIDTFPDNYYFYQIFSILQKIYGFDMILPTKFTPFRFPSFLLEYSNAFVFILKSQN